MCLLNWLVGSLLIDMRVSAASPPPRLPFSVLDIPLPTPCPHVVSRRRAGGIRGLAEKGNLLRCSFSAGGSFPGSGVSLLRGFPLNSEEGDSPVVRELWAP